MPLSPKRSAPPGEDGPAAGGALVRVRPKAKAALMAFCGAALLAVFGLNFFTPLRINTDVFRYLRMALAHINFPGERYHEAFPWGYPVFISFVEGATSSANFWLIATNFFVYLFSVALFARCFFGSAWSASRKALFVALCLLNFIFIKHYTLIIADVIFSGLCLVFVALCSFIKKAPPVVSIAGFLCALAFLAMMLSLRGASICLFFPLAFSLADKFLQVSSFEEIKRRANRATLAMAFGAAALFFVFLTNSQYFKYINFSAFTPGMIKSKFYDLNQLAMNIPFNKIGEPLAALACVPGTLAWGAVFYYLFLKFFQEIDEADIFFLAYFSMISLWPFTDTRFALPLAPFFFAYVLNFSIKARAEKLFRACACAYCAFGLLALAYSISISLAGREAFVQRYGEAATKRAYRNALENPATKSEKEALREVDRDALLSHMLARFDPDHFE